MVVLGVSRGVFRRRLGVPLGPFVAQRSYVEELGPLFADVLVVLDLIVQQHQRAEVILVTACQGPAPSPGALTRWGPKSLYPKFPR